MTSKHPAIPIDDNFEDVLICAVRYALGRQTYITGTVSEYVIRLLPHLSDRAITVIMRDIGKADDLGDTNIDVPNWNRLACRCREEFERRKKNASD